jgi:hypothetical protein
VGKSSVKLLPCYRIVFDDTSVVECDEEHLWRLWGGTVIPVIALRPNHIIAVAGALNLPEIPLPIDPYVLGLWLADGKHTSGEITKPDASVWEEIQRRGYEISHDYSEKAGAGKCRVHTVFGLRTALRENNLLGNKYIPHYYLRASYAQRLALLQGLMDGDGSANKGRRQAIFTTVNEMLSNQVMELLLTLGQRPLQSCVKGFGFGKWVDVYSISFRPRNIVPFLMPRKADACIGWGEGHSWRRRVASVEILEVPRKTQCVAVDSADNMFLCGRKFIPTHNSGKRYPDFDQTEMSAHILFSQKPKLQRVKQVFIWTRYGDGGEKSPEKLHDSKNTHRDEAPVFWAKTFPRIERMKYAFEHNDYYEKPSGLCGWCWVKTCKHCPNK